MIGRYTVRRPMLRNKKQAEKPVIEIFFGDMLLRFHCFNQFRKYCRKFLCQIHHNFPVESYILFLQEIDEARIGKTVFTDGGVDIERPKRAEFSFLFSAIIKRVRSGFQAGNFGEFDFAFAPPFVATRALKYIFNAPVMGNSSFDSRHNSAVSG